MTNSDMYYEAEEKLLDEMEKEKNPFSFRNLLRAIALSSIAVKF